MGGGQAPPGVNLGTGGSLDDGTLARMRAPAPGTIGVGAKGGGKEAGPAAPGEEPAPARTPAPADAPAASEPTVDFAAVIAYARRLIGRHDPNGRQCVTLVDRALRAGRALGYRTYGQTGPDDDYVWGTIATLDELQPGDVVQFRNHRCEVRTQELGPNGRPTGTEETIVQERPHHSALVEEVGEDGSVTLLEQNVPPGSVVSRRQVYFANQRVRDGNQRITVTVSGSAWFYRPQPR